MRLESHSDPDNMDRWNATFTGQNTHNAQKPEDNGNGDVIDHIMYNPEKMKVLDGEIIDMEKPL